MALVNNDSGTHLTTISFLSNNHRDMDNLNFDYQDHHSDIRLRKVPWHS